MMSNMKRRTHKHAPQAFSWTDGMLPTLGATDEPKGHMMPYRLIVFILVILIVMIVIVGRLVSLQIIASGQYSVLADVNRLSEQYIPYERGLILDVDGVVLARNIPTYEAVVDLQTVSKSQRTVEWLDSVANIFGIEPIELETNIDKAIQKGSTEVVVKSDVSQELFISYMTNSEMLHGLAIQPAMKRYYPSGASTAHIVGYLGEINPEERKKKEYADYLNGEELGRAGIEATYQTILRGTPGLSAYKTVPGDSNSEVSTLREPVPGRSVSLSISGELQLKVLDELRAFMEEHEAPSGVVIVQDVHTGELRVLASLPSYDNNLFTDGLTEGEFSILFEDEAQPLYDRAIAGKYPPGSLVKPIVSAAALQENLITATTRLTDTPQVIEIGGGRFSDWRVAWGRGPYGPMTVKEAIAQSSNIFFYKISGGYEEQAGLGIKRMAEYFNAFGLGRLTGIDLPGESPGVMPNPAWKLANKNESWYLGDDYQVGIGQGDLLVTPLQMANATSAIANGGVLYQARLASALYDYDDVLIEELPSRVIRELPLTAAHIKTIQEGMRLAVSEGIVFPLRDTKVSVAAKTGTAEFGVVRDDEGTLKTHAWVEGYFPYDAPKYSFVVLLENGGASQYAAELAAKVVDMMYESKN